MFAGGFGVGSAVYSSGELMLTRLLKMTPGKAVAAGHGLRHPAGTRELKSRGCGRLGVGLTEACAGHLLAGPRLAVSSLHSGALSGLAP